MVIFFGIFDTPGQAAKGIKYFFLQGWDCETETLGSGVCESLILPVAPS